MWERALMNGSGTKIVYFNKRGVSSEKFCVFKDWEIYNYIGWGLCRGYLHLSCSINPVILPVMSNFVSKILFVREDDAFHTLG
jgi:hypothetical protein